MITLLAVAPMQQVPVDVDDERNISEETAKFTAECHVNFFQETFEFYDIDLRQWIKASIADNTKTNLKIARSLGVPHVGCNNHKLNLDVELWVKNTAQLQHTIDDVHATMLSAKSKLKNAALLQNETDLKPVIHNKTRWSGKFKMLKQWIVIRNELIQVSNNPGSDDLYVNSSVAYLGQVQKYTGWFGDINKVTVFMQRRCCTLAAC